MHVGLFNSGYAHVPCIGQTTAAGTVFSRKVNAQRSKCVGLATGMCIYDSCTNVRRTCARNQSAGTPPVHRLSTVRSSRP